MQDLKVKCPNCGRINFVTTDSFNPEVAPNGGMVKCLLPYQIDWLCSSTTMASEMTCPECLAPLVVGNVLNVVMPAREAGEMFHEALTDDQKRILQDGEIKKEQLRTSIPAMELPEGAQMIGEPQIDFISPPPGSEVQFTEINKLIDGIKNKFICDICGRECKSELGLNSHKRSHKGGKK